MRIYKPESTRAIPPGAKVNREKGTVTYKGRDGRSVRAVLTDSGKMRVSQGVWHIGFRDSLDRQQDIATFAIESQSRLLAGQIEKLIVYCGQPIPSELRECCDRLPSRIVIALQEAGLLEKNQSPLAGPLDSLVTMYQQALQRRERNAEHIAETGRMIREVFATCQFKKWVDIQRDAVDGFLRDLREGPRHVSYRRSNAYLTACQALANWIVNDRQWARENPLRGLRKLDVTQDQRHQHAVMENGDVFNKLLQAADAGPTRFNLSGRERKILYELAVESGLRRGEIERLRVGDFDLENHRVIVRGVKATKNKRDRVKPLSPGLCGDLSDLLTNKMPDVLLFHGLTPHTARMMRLDLERAGIPYQDSTGHFHDFHSLRGQCSSVLTSSGIDIKTTADILGHASVTTTLKHYTKAVGQANANHAATVLHNWYADEQQSVKTGTDDAPELYGQLYSQVEEALCWGWVDSRIRRIDSLRFARWFTPRRPKSRWSPSNVERAKEMKAEGRMTEAGLLKVREAERTGTWSAPRSRPRNLEVPSFLGDAIITDPKARENFQRMAGSYRDQFIAWVSSAKTEATRKKRVQETLEKLKRNEKLGLK